MDTLQEKFNAYRQRIREGNTPPPEEYAELVDLLRAEQEKAIANKARKPRKGKEE